MEEINKQYLREITESDVDLLFEWVNDPDVRKNSFQSDSISYEEHKLWFINMMKCDNVKQYIYVCDGHDVGQIRINIKDENAEIGYSIAKKYRRMGYGKCMVEALTNKIKSEFPEIKKIIAQVKPTNIASLKAFVDCGYTEKCKVFELDLT